MFPEKTKTEAHSIAPMTPNPNTETHLLAILHFVT